MLRILIVLLIVLVSYAADPNSVLLVANINCNEDSLDTNEDGIPDWRNIVEAWMDIYPSWDTTLVCSLYTKACYIRETEAADYEWKSESVAPRYLRYAWDVSTDTLVESSPGVRSDLSYNSSYIIDDIAAFIEERDAWCDIRYVVPLMGMPLRVMGPSTNGTLPQNGSGYYITAYHSLDDVIRSYVCPDAADSLWESPRPIGRYARQLSPNTYSLSTDCGTMIASNVTSAFYNVTAETLYIYVGVSRLDGIGVDHVISALNRSAGTSPYEYSPLIGRALDSENKWVFDGKESPPDNPLGLWGRDPMFRDSFMVYYNYSDMIYDTIGVDSNCTGKRDIDYHIALNDGCDSVDGVFLYCGVNRAYDSSIPTDFLWQLKLNYVDGALYISPESYSAFCMRDTAFIPHNPRQGQITEAIASGMTYAVGQSWEPYYSLMPYYNMRYLPTILNRRGVTFGEAVTILAPATLWQTVAIGNPIGKFTTLQSLSPPSLLTLSNLSYGGCNDKYHLSFVSDSIGIDSVHVFVFYEKDADTSYYEIADRETLQQVYGRNWNLNGSIDSLWIVQIDTNEAHDTIRIQR